VRALEQPRKVRLCLVHIDDLHRTILTKSLDLVNRRGRFANLIVRSNRNA
jgi:hypothetical protein